MESGGIACLFGKSAAEVGIAKSVIGLWCGHPGCPRLMTLSPIILANFQSVLSVSLTSSTKAQVEECMGISGGFLLFTFTVQMDDGTIVPLLQYVISLAIIESMKDICDKRGLPHLDLNLLNGLKVGGILCTPSYRSKKFNISAVNEDLSEGFNLLFAFRLMPSRKFIFCTILAGIGLNVNNEEPMICLNKVLWDLSNSSYKFSREEILAAFFNKFEDLFDKFVNQGECAMCQWNACPVDFSLPCLAWTLFRQIDDIFKCRISNSRGALLLDMVTQGFTPSGYLLAFGDDDQLCELHPDGNSLDFFKGLVRR